MYLRQNIFIKRYLYAKQQLIYFTLRGSKSLIVRPFYMYIPFCNAFCAGSSQMLWKTFSSNYYFIFERNLS